MSIEKTGNFQEKNFFWNRIFWFTNYLFFGTLPLWDSICWTSGGFRWLVRWQVLFLSHLLFWTRTVSLNICCYLYWLFSAWSLQILLTSLRFLASTNGQSCIPEVKELRQPFLKHPISFIFLLRHWCAVSCKFLLLKNFRAVRDILLGSISSKVRVLFFKGRIEPMFPKTLRRDYDLVFSNFA